MVPVSKESAENLAYRQIKSLLLHYKLAPGQRLVYQDLANRFKVSRTPIKNALSRLEQEGYVTLIPEKGYVLKEVTLKEAAEMLTVLETLERYAVEHIVKANVDPARLAKLEDILEEYSDAVRKGLGPERFIVDARLHIKLVELAENGFLTDLVAGIFEKIYLQIRISGLSQRRAATAKNEHESILRAIERRELRTAVRWVRVHARNRKSNILKNAFPSNHRTNLKTFFL